MYVREIEEPPVSAKAYFRNTSLSTKLYYLTTDQHNRYNGQNDRLEPTKDMPGFINGRKCLSKET